MNDINTSENFSLEIISDTGDIIIISDSKDTIPKNEYLKNTIFIDNIPKNINKKTIEQIFSKFGKVYKINFFNHENRIVNYAFVIFSNIISVKNYLSKKIQINGKYISIQLSKYERNRSPSRKRNSERNRSPSRKRNSERQSRQRSRSRERHPERSRSRERTRSRSRQRHSGRTRSRSSERYFERPRYYQNPVEIPRYPVEMFRYPEMPRYPEIPRYPVEMSRYYHNPVEIPRYPTEIPKYYQNPVGKDCILDSNTLNFMESLRDQLYGIN